MLNKIKQTFSRLINFITGEDLVSANAAKLSEAKEDRDRKVLLIGKNQSNFNDIKSIITQLNHNCICVETIKQAIFYIYSEPRLVVVDFARSILNESFFNLQSDCKSFIIVFIDLATAEKIKDRSIFLARKTSYSEKTILVEKSLFAECALSLFSKYLCGDATPIIKWEEKCDRHY